MKYLGQGVGHPDKHEPQGRRSRGLDEGGEADSVDSINLI
jgi:hypothetical protein